MVDTPELLPFPLSSTTGELADANQIIISGTNLTGLLSGAASAQAAYERIDATGLGATFTTFSASFTATVLNIDTWFNGLQQNVLRWTDDGPSLPPTFTLPNTAALNAAFDALQTAGLPEQLVLIVEYTGPSTTQLNIVPAGTNDPQIFNLSRVLVRSGIRVRLEITRSGSTISNFLFQNIGGVGDTTGGTLDAIKLNNPSVIVWDASSNGRLPSSGVVKGDAYKVVNAPSDGSGRFGEVMQNDDWVVWEGATFTSWDAVPIQWFVIPAHEVRRITALEQDFLTEVEISDVSDRNAITRGTNYADDVGEIRMKIYPTRANYTAADLNTTGDIDEYSNPTDISGVLAVRLQGTRQSLLQEGDLQTLYVYSEDANGEFTLITKVDETLSHEGDFSGESDYLGFDTVNYNAGETWRIYLTSTRNRYEVRTLDIAEENLDEELQRKVNNQDPESRAKEQRLESAESRLETLSPLLPDVGDLVGLADVYEPERTATSVEIAPGNSLFVDYRGDSSRYESAGVTYDNSGSNVVRYTGLTDNSSRAFGFSVNGASNQVLMWVLDGSTLVPFIDTTAAGALRINDFTPARTVNELVNPSQGRFGEDVTATGDTSLIPGDSNSRRTLQIPDFPSGSTERRRSLHIQFEAFVVNGGGLGLPTFDINLPVDNTAIAPIQRELQTIDAFNGGYLTVRIEYAIFVQSNQLRVEFRVLNATPDVTSVRLLTARLFRSYRADVAEPRVDNYRTFTLDGGGAFNFSGSHEFALAFRDATADGRLTVSAVGLTTSSGQIQLLADQEVHEPSSDFGTVEVPDAAAVTGYEFRTWLPTGPLNRQNLEDLIGRRAVQWVYGLARFRSATEHAFTEQIDFNNDIVLTSPDASRWQVSINNSGVLQTTKLQAEYMAKIDVLDTIVSAFSSITKLNANFTKITAALNNTLSRDGSSPNAMGADLDMNSNKVINLPDATTATEPTRLSQTQSLIANAGFEWEGAWTTATAYIENELVQNNGNSYICISNHIAAAENEPGVGAQQATFWDLLSSKGDQGVTGQDGANGQDGLWAGTEPTVVAAGADLIPIRDNSDSNNPKFALASEFIGGGGGGATSFISFPVALGSTASGSAAAFKGLIFTATTDITVSSILAKLNSVSTGVYQGFIAEIDGSGVTQTMNLTQTYVASASRVREVARVAFAAPINLTAGTRYAIMFGRTDAGDAHNLAMFFSGTQLSLSAPGFTENFTATLADAAPAVGDTITLSSASDRFIVAIEYNITQQYSRFYMAGTTLDMETFFASAGLGAGPEQLAVSISNQYQEWNSHRVNWLREKHELRDYLFATDTRSTSNSHLPWKNRTTVPKLTQIRDNLHANYMAALFPSRNWLRWEGAEESDEIQEKREAIENYIRTKLIQDNGEVKLSELLLDYIDDGNCCATVKWVDDSYENPETGEVIRGYVGPRIIRIPMKDIVFNPLASRFEDSPKIVRTLITVGEMEKRIQSLPEGPYKTRLREVMDNSYGLRRATSSLEGTDALVNDAFDSDGFGSYWEYLQSSYVEILTFYGDLYDIDARILKDNYVVEVIDRAFVTRDEPNPNWTTSDFFHHAGWRQRPGNLYAMGPLDNLVGMQYRIDHLENLKADVFDLVAFPVQKVRGYVEDYTYEPGARIYVGDDGDVEFMSPDVTALNADIQIRELQLRMEELAGAPREAMGIRTPGEKTAFEVQTLDNAASRLFLNKIRHFEKVFLEPLLNDMLAVARQNMQASDVARSMSSEINAIIFSTVTRDDITARGTLRPTGARHFAERATQMQNILNLLNNPAMQDPAVSVHLSGKKLAKVLEELADLDDFEVYGDNIRAIEQAETQQMIAAAGEQAEVNAATPPGIVEADLQF